MNQTKNRKLKARWFSQNDYFRPIGGALLIVGMIWFWLGMSAASYYGPIVMMPVGLAMFIFGSIRYVSESNIMGERDKLLEGYDSAVTGADDYERRILKHPADLEIGSFDLKAGTVFRRDKNGSVVSDVYVRSHFFFTKDMLLVCAWQVSLLEMNGETGEGARNIGGQFAFSGIVSCRTEEEELRVTIANTKKQTTVRVHELVLDGEAGELLRLPVTNDARITGLCEEIERRVSPDKPDFNVGV